MVAAVPQHIAESLRLSDEIPVYPEAMPPRIWRRSLKVYLVDANGKPEAYRHVLRQSRRFWMKVMSTIEVTRTYLEMREPSELDGARNDDPRIRVEQLPDCSPSFFRYLYVEVGRNYHWIDRLPWTDEDIAAHLRQPEISLWLMTEDGANAGYFELRLCEDGSVEIAYFGLLTNFIGRGLGKHLLTCAVWQAWAEGANRVWLHTCTLDDPAAMPNYLKRGFRAFKTEKYLANASE